MRRNRHHAWKEIEVRKIMSVAAASVLLSTVMVSGTVAAGPPIGGCPTGSWWRLILPIHQPQAADHNGDAWLCRLDLPSGSFTFHDNVVRLP
jgi:hypothetical protein